MTQTGLVSFDCQVCKMTKETTDPQKFTDSTVFMMLLTNIVVLMLLEVSKELVLEQDSEYWKLVALLNSSSTPLKIVIQVSPRIIKLE